MPKPGLLKVLAAKGLELNAPLLPPGAKPLPGTKPGFGLLKEGLEPPFLGLGLEPGLGFAPEFGFGLGFTGLDAPGPGFGPFFGVVVPPLCAAQATVKPAINTIEPNH